MEAAQYWKIRARAYALVLERERAAAAVAHATEQLTMVLREADLDPKITYRFDDEALTLTPAPNPA